ncbi:hypothetical protein [Sphingomonas sp. IC081]|uniref:hypothetical protein n=1 Tax=Sphingomonas sp. IC081 TaxID=304378 RepID=UPI00163CCFED|nr:hypothetical protein [Sphingomonas sp. IC081]
MSLPRAPLLRRVSLVSLAVAAMAGSAAPALAEDAAAPDADTANTIVVTGDLAAQRKALTEKREALNAVETLQANDVGKLPDQNRLAVTGDASGLMCTATTLVRHREEDDNTRSVTLGREFDDVAGGKLELSGGWTRATKDDPVRSEFTFTGAKGKTAIDYDGSTDPYTMVAGDAALFARPSSFAFSKYNFEQRHAYEQLWQGRIDYTHPIAIGDGSTFAIGAKYIDRHKADDHDKVDYKAGSTKWTLDQGGATMGDDSFYGGMFDFGTRIDYAAARAYLAANPAVEKEDTAGTLSDSLASDYDVREKIAAGYVMATLKFGGWYWSPACASNTRWTIPGPSRSMPIPRWMKATTSSAARTTQTLHPTWWPRRTMSTTSRWAIPI